MTLTAREAPAPPDVSLVLVAHRSSEVLPAAVDSFRREAAALGLAAEVVVVEHSEDAAEAERVAASSPDVLLVRPNRGYAAGVNAGLAVARSGLLLVGNPDVELLAGSLRPLLAALDGDAEVAAPQLRLGSTLFPPAEAQTPMAELRRRRAGRSRRAWERHLRRELREWDRVWTSAGPVVVPALSGALLAFRRELAARLGPWDEAYFLYFEETDWLRRARRQGARLAVVPRAPAVHRWGHSAPPEEWEEGFAASQRRFYRKGFGRWRSRVLDVSRRLPMLERWPPVLAQRADRWLLSPSPAGFPAALVEAGTLVEEAARGFCDASGRAAVTLVGIDASHAFLGPYAWQPKMRA